MSDQSADKDAAAAAYLAKLRQRNLDETKSPKAGKRLWAAFGLKRYRDPEVFEALTGLVADPDHEVREQVARSLAAFGADALPALRQLGADTHPGVRAAALAALDEPGAHDELRRMLAEPRSRFAIVTALGKSGSDRMLDLIFPLLGDADAWTRRTAIKALSGIASAKAIKPLVGLLDDPDKDIRRKAIEALGMIGNAGGSDASAIDRLLMLLKSDPHVHNRAACVQALGRIKGDRARAACLVALRDSEPHVRMEAIAAVAKDQKDNVPEVVDALVELLLHDPAGAVREWAASHLGYVRAAAVEPLMAALSDAEARVRLGAVVALGRVGDGRAVARLTALFDEATTGAYFNYYITGDIVMPGSGFDAPNKDWARLEIIHTLEAINLPESLSAAGELRARLALDPKYSGERRRG